MRIRTQNLPNSFSSDNEKQKAALPETAPRGTRFGESDLAESIDNWQWGQTTNGSRGWAEELLKAIEESP
jgi:hypothetical protein